MKYYIRPSTDSIVLYCEKDRLILGLLHLEDGEIIRWGGIDFAFLRTNLIGRIEEDHYID